MIKALCYHHKNKTRFHHVAYSVYFYYFTGTNTGRKDIELWKNEFGWKHYLVFGMKFE